MKPKNVYFFKNEKFLQYKARDDIVNIDGEIGPLWTGFTDAGFDTGFDAALNAGNGFIYFFKDEYYIRYDPRLKRVDIPKTLISVNWPQLTTVGFDRGLNAAMYYRDGKVLFFKGDKYLRYNISDDTIDRDYPKKISVGWSGIASTPFANGIDAAVNFGEGKAYFFKDNKYIRIDIANNAVDGDYLPPLDTAEQWPALVPYGFTSGLSDVVEWPYCEVSAFNVQVGLCEERFPDQITQPPHNNKFGRPVIINAILSAPAYPADCRCGEYRQFVRGEFIVNGERLVTSLCSNTDCNLEVLPRPADEASNDNFLEDSLPRSVSSQNLFYGHREVPQNDITDRYLPDRATGCNYLGTDFPFVEGLPRASYTLDLDFRGVIIDVCNDNEEIVNKRWKVFCTGTFSQQPLP